MSVDVRILEAGDESVLAMVAPDVFDHPIEPELAQEFLSDPRHHIAVAIEDGVVIGFASGVDYIHPDKPRELWINEVGVSPAHRNRGIGKRVLESLLDHGRTLGCVAAWVLTDQDNDAAKRLYASAGGSTMKGDTLGFEFEL